jgi:hypothetical protein
MKIPENILNTITDEQKKKLEAQEPRKNSLPLRKKDEENCLWNRWKAFPEVGVSIAMITIA